jgi:hypothetical protein
MHISARSGPGVSNTRVYFSSVIGSTKTMTVVAWAAPAEPSSATPIAERKAVISSTPWSSRGLGAGH